MLDLQPILTGTHITLRPLAAQDFDELFAAASDPSVWAQHPDPGRGTREGFPPFFDGALKSKGCLVAIDAARRSAIGWSRYSNYAPRWGQIHVMYRLTPRLWARGAVPGYGPEPVQLPLRGVNQ